MLDEVNKFCEQLYSPENFFKVIYIWFLYQKSNSSLKIFPTFQAHGENYRARSGRIASHVVILPAADVSDAANDSQSDEAQQHFSEDDTGTDESDAYDDDDVPPLPVFPMPV